MREQRARFSRRPVTTIMNAKSRKSLIASGFILLILGIALLITALNYDFKSITKTVPSTESKTNAASEAISSVSDKASEVEKNVVETVDQAKDDLGITKLQQIYKTFTEVMTDIEQSIANLDNLFVVAVLLLLIFFSKAYVSFVPISVTFMLSGFIFPLPVAFLINYIGVAFILTHKYLNGLKKEENGIHKIMSHFPTIEKLVEGEMLGSDSGNPILLFILRLIPIIPVNPISQLYGYMEYPFFKYLLISLLGYSLKLIPFTTVGKGIHDPFRSSFFVVFSILFIISGLAMITLGFGLKQAQETDKEKRAELAKEEEEDLI